MAEPYGYVVQSGYIGYVAGKKRLFATEEEYREVIFDLNEKEED